MYTHTHSLFLYIPISFLAVWSVKSFLVKKKGLSGKEVDRLLGITGDFDYVEFKPKRAKK
jgi:hypothetical protein